MTKRKPIIRFCGLHRPENVRTIITKERLSCAGQSITKDFPCQFVGVDEDPDVVELAGHHTRIHQLAICARRRFGWRPLLVTKYGENVKQDRRNPDYIFSSHPTAGKHICYAFEGLSELAHWNKYRRQPKTEFCNYVYSNDWMPDTRIRRDFCLTLMEYKRVDCPGASLRNTTFPVYSLSRRLHPTVIKLLFIKDYKFTIAFENSRSSSYITEKISHPLAVGSIPIYYGCLNAADYYNPRAFINCHDYPDFDAVIERIREVDNEPALYAEYLDAPPVLPHNHFYDLPKKVRQAWTRIAEESLARRAAPPGIPDRLMPGACRRLRLCLMILRNLDKITELSLYSVLSACRRLVGSSRRTH